MGAARTSRGCVLRFAISFLSALALPSVHAQTTTVAGFTPGSFQVSPSGAAIYTVPIQVPPGIAGMESKLALTYNSQGGNGLLGMGWSLSGLSAITRCPRTVAQDGVKGGINYDSNDRYCLDGQRLVMIAGASYGADGAEYRTEQESFTKVISYGIGGNGPAWFKAWTKSGQVMEFGLTVDSRVEAQGKTPTVGLWVLNKIQDTKGNYLTITYTEDYANGEYYPARYDYTGNAAAGQVTYASVRFSYATRPDPIYTNIAGSAIRTSVQLTNIRTYVGEAMIKDYRLNYEQGAAGSRSRLTGVTECTGDGLSCLPTIAFSWKEPVVGPQNWTWTGGHGVGDSGWQLGDLFGDGRQVYWTHSGNGTHYATRFVSLAPDLLLSVANGPNPATTIAYKPLTDGAIYSKDSGAVYPTRDLKAPIYAVSSTSQTNGIGGNYITNYFYTGAKTHLQGGGYLGFRKFEMTDAQTNIKTASTFRQDYPFQGLPISIVKTQLSGAVLNQVATTWTDNPAVNALTYNFSTGKYHRSDLTQSVETSNDLNGTVLPTVTTTTSYDAYGNATGITVSTGDGYSKTTTNTFTNDTANWFLGRLTRSQVISTTP